MQNTNYTQWFWDVNILLHLYSQHYIVFLRYSAFQNLKVRFF